MELKQIKEMMAAMTRHGTKRLVIKQTDFELELERECSHPNHFEISATPMPAMGSAPRPHHEIPSFIHPGLQNPAQNDGVGNFVTSPMVGTFYFSPAPEEPAFVKPGDKVEPDTVVCIIEAMKVMNEVKAGISGTISEILVENGHPVEFGTKLFRVV